MSNPEFATRGEEGFIPDRDFELAFADLLSARQNFARACDRVWLLATRPRRIPKYPSWGEGVSSTLAQAGGAKPGSRAPGPSGLGPPVLSEPLSRRAGEGGRESDG